MDKKNNKGVIILIVILILCIIGLVFYILVDKEILNFNHSTIEKEQVEKNNTKEDKKDTKGIEISVDNENIKTLFNNAHRLSIGPETSIYKDGGYKVSEMTLDEKFSLLSSQWFNKIETHPDYVMQTNEQITELSEETLKNLYEKTFGPNTYKSVDSITDSMNCLTLTYDEIYQRYITKEEGGCGGSSTFSTYEKIIKVTKYNNRIEILSAVVYLDGMSQQMYKDYNKTTSLGALLVNENITNNSEEREKAYNKYIEENKDKLEQYKYIYKLNEDGFYYLMGVERIKK